MSRDSIACGFIGCLDAYGMAYVVWFLGVVPTRVVGQDRRRRGIGRGGGGGEDGEERGGGVLGLRDGVRGGTWEAGGVEPYGG